MTNSSNKLTKLADSLLTLAINLRAADSLSSEYRPDQAYDRTAVKSRSVIKVKLFPQQVSRSLNETSRNLRMKLPHLHLKNRMIKLLFRKAEIPDLLTSDQIHWCLVGNK